MIEKIGCLVVDDEDRAIRIMELLLTKHCPEVEILATAENIDEAYRKMVEFQPSLIFLDVNMTGGTGLELLERLEGIDVQVVFTTAHQEHAINALRLSAFDFLLKPIDPTELKDAVKRFRTHKKNNNYSLIQSILKEEKPKRIVINSQDGIQVVEIEDILYLSADRNYCEFHMVDSKLIASKPLVEYEKLLSGIQFLRVHKSYLVNLHHIKEYKKGRDGKLILSNKEELEVSRNKKDDLLDALKAL
ncbi:LytR/AlgR family response regulator transcription factor [Marinoscillum pacificum]|uniref:LytR/AlgR family response regulator transcription factor n=1 Tax=Marinoscillum pacificum TaxID=392723 RepID=UPI00215775BF|nr:LytTR family DNA-binding domain-containing protein [Marinoscillum pacificum]